MAETMIGDYLLTQLNKMREANCLCDLELISSDGTSFKVHHAVFVALNQRHFERYHHSDHLMEETWLSSASKKMLLSMVTTEELRVVVEFIYGVPVTFKSRFGILKDALKKLAMDNLMNEQGSSASFKPEDVLIKTELEEEEVQEVSDTIASDGSRVTLVKDNNNVQQDIKNLDPLMMSNTEVIRKQNSSVPNNTSNEIAEKDFHNKTTSSFLQKNSTNAAQKENIDNLGVCKAKKSNVDVLNRYQLDNLIGHKSLSVKLVRLPENIKSGFLCTHQSLPDRKLPTNQRHNVEADTNKKKIMKHETFRYQRRQSYQNRLRNHSKGIKLSSLISANKMGLNGTKTMEVAPKAPCKTSANFSSDNTKQANGQNGVEDQPCACNNPVDRIFTGNTSVNEKTVDDQRMGNINDKNEINITKSLNNLENSSMESPFNSLIDEHEFRGEGPQSSLCQDNLRDNTDHNARTVKTGRGRSLSLCRNNLLVKSNVNASKEKRGRGRPRSLCKNNPEVKGNHNSQKENQGNRRPWSFCKNYLHVKTVHNASKGKRGRGRPRSLCLNKDDRDDDALKEKRGRGRPRSLCGKSLQVKGNDNTPKEKQGRGRPRSLCLTNLKNVKDDDVPIENRGKERLQSSSVQITAQTCAEQTSGSICGEQTPNENADMIKLKIDVQNNYFKKKSPCYAFDSVKREAQDNLGDSRCLAQNSFENDVVQQPFQNNSNTNTKAVNGIPKGMVDSRKGTLQNKHETLVRYLMQPSPSSDARESKEDSSSLEFSIATPSRQILPLLQPELGALVKNSPSCTDSLANDGSGHDKTTVSPQATSLKYHLETKSISDKSTCKKDKQPTTSCTNIFSGTFLESGNLLISPQSSLFTEKTSESKEDKAYQNTIKPSEYSIVREKLSKPVSVRMNHQPNDKTSVTELDVDIVEPAKEHLGMNVVCERQDDILHSQTSDKKFMESKEIPTTVNSANGTNSEGKHNGNDTLAMGKKGHEMSIETPNPYVLHLNKTSVCDGKRMLLLAQVRNNSKGIMQTGQITNRFPLYPHKYRAPQVATLRSILPKPLDQTFVDESDMANSTSMFVPLTCTEKTSSNQCLPEKHCVTPENKVKVPNEKMSNSMRNTEKGHLSLKTEDKRHNEVPVLRNILQKPFEQASVKESNMNNSTSMFVPVTCSETPSSNQCFPEKSSDGNDEEKHSKSLTSAFGKKGRKRSIETPKLGDNHSDALHLNKTSVNEGNLIHLAQVRNNRNGIMQTGQITNRFPLYPQRAPQVATPRSILPKPLDQTCVDESDMENSTSVFVPLTCTEKTSSNQCLPKKQCATPEKNRTVQSVLLEKNHHIQNTGKRPRTEVRKDNEVTMLRSILPKPCAPRSGNESDKDTSSPVFVPLTCAEKMSRNQCPVSVTSEKKNLLLTEKVPHLMQNTENYQRSLDVDVEKDIEDISEERKYESSKSSRNMSVGLKALDTVKEINFALNSYNNKYFTYDSVRKQGDVAQFVDDMSEEDSVPLSVLALTLKSEREKEKLKQNTCAKLSSSELDLNSNIDIDKCTVATVKGNQEKLQHAQCTNEVENMGTRVTRNMRKEDTRLCSGIDSYQTVGLGQNLGSKSPYSSNQLVRQKYSVKRKKLGRNLITVSVKKDNQFVCNENIEFEFSPESVLKKTLSFVEDEDDIP